MQRILWPVAPAVALLSCGYPALPQLPTPAQFGLDARPSNTTCVVPKRPLIDTDVALERQWAGLSFTAPTFLTQAPGDNAQWFVVERAGKVRAFPGDATSNTQVRDFVTVTVNATGEGGLLGFAFHPRWSGAPGMTAKREAYLSYTRTQIPGEPEADCNGADANLTSVIERYTSTDDGGSLNTSTADPLVLVAQPFTNHNGGGIQFGPDGYLYIGLGDGGNGNDPCGSGQNRASLLGKMLRIDINTPAGAYNIPPDNPFATDPVARKEIWASGLRNPWRWSFDQESGDLWVGDVGQGTWEEIDLVVKGGNYGWNTCEGRHRRGSEDVLCNTAGLLDPVAEHPRSEAASITGGFVYRGSAIPGLVGSYIYGDFVSGNIWALINDSSNKPIPTVIAHVAGNSLVSFGQGNDGEVYTVQAANGTGPGVFSKLVPAGVRPVDPFPQLLSATGCVDPADPTKPAEGLIPYDVNSPLWSDGAEKERYLAIPDGKTITVNADQDWDLPIGSVVMKTFSVGGDRIETRLFMRHDDGDWAGYTYEWNATGTEAALLATGKTRPLAGEAVWAYPSRSQCLQCHTDAAGGTLGLETAQLNRETVYASTSRRSNQLATLDHIGMFTAPLQQPPEEGPHLAVPASTDSLEARARSYLHANCSHCHRPMGGGQGTLDLRYTQSFLDTHTCNAGNTQGPVAGAVKLLVPGAPEQSLLSARMHAGDTKRMPPISVNVTDPTGTAVVDDWIRALTACP